MGTLIPLPVCASRPIPLVRSSISAVMSQLFPIMQENEKLDVLVKKQRAEVLKLQANLEKAVSFSLACVCVHVWLCF